MFARMLRWVRTTPFGSDVAPDVKITSATSSGPCSIAGMARGGAAEAVAAIFHTGASMPPRSGTASPTTIARALTIAATRRRKSAEAR